MTVQHWRDAVVASTLAGRILARHDLVGLLRAGDLAGMAGPILDPTLWREKGAAMEQDMELLRAALPLWERARAAGAATSPLLVLADLESREVMRAMSNALGTAIDALEQAAAFVDRLCICKDDEPGCVIHGPDGFLAAIGTARAAQGIAGAVEAAAAAAPPVDPPPALR